MFGDKPGWLKVAHPPTETNVGVLRLRRTTRFANRFCYAQDDNLELDLRRFD
jgi:hypothetical protein